MEVRERQGIPKNKWKIKRKEKGEWRNFVKKSEEKKKEMDVRKLSEIEKELEISRDKSKVGR